MEWYVEVNGKRLKRGFTTGTSATAALKASVKWIKYEKKPEKVDILLPNGEKVYIPIFKYEKINGFKYAFVKKDAGDDADITNNCLVYCTYLKNDNGIEFDSFEGVGKVTKKGLDINIGEYAINPIPRNMMEEILKNEGIFNAKVIVNVKDGEKIAEKTLNKNLGINGGISILGTTGIVEPMSETAWKESLIPHIKMISSNYDSITLLIGGKGLNNYKKTNFFKEDFILCGNHIGYSIEKAIEFGIKNIKILGSFQKIIKLSGLNLNTDSRYSDSKNELLALMYILFIKEYDEKIIKRILNLNPVYNFIDILKEKNIKSNDFFDFVSKYTGERLNKRFNVEFDIYLCEKY